MGFGFVVARFGLFLQALQTGQSNIQARPYGISFWFGTALIVLGVVINIACVWNHLRLVQDLNRGGSAFKSPSWLAVAVAVTLAVIGLAMAVYLISIREPTSVEGLQEKSMTSTPENGIVSIPSHHTVDETAERVEKALQAKGVKLFALIDHSGEAARAGMQMRPTKLLIFGNPKAGTPLMVAAPGMAIDLPMKLLIAEDADGKVWISYNAPSYISARHGLSQELALAYSGLGVEALAAKVAE